MKGKSFHKPLLIISPNNNINSLKGEPEGRPKYALNFSKTNCYKLIAAPSDDDRVLHLDQNLLKLHKSYQFFERSHK